MRKLVLTFFFLAACSACIALVAPAAAAQVVEGNNIVSGMIDTYAGGGAYVNAPPLSVAMRPAALAVGPDGGIYVDEPSEVNGDEAPNPIEDSEIFRIDPATGTVTRVVGNGIDGSSGIGGSPTDVSLYDPLGLAFDNQGNLYVADTGNNRILKISADPAFDPADPTALAGGPITSRSVVSVFPASFTHPVSLAFDSNFSNLYVATLGGVTRISLADDGMTMVAGCANTSGCGEGLNGVPATTVYIEPADDGNDLAFDSAGNLYIAAGYGENADHVFRVNSAGILTSVAGDESAGGKSCTQPSTADGVNFTAQSIAFDPSGDLLLDDLYQDLVCKISPDPSTGIIDANSPIVPVAGGGEFLRYGFAQYGQPGYGDGGPANQAALLYPDGIAVDHSGNVFVSDGTENRVRKITVDPSTGVVDGDSLVSTAAGAGGTGPGAVGGDGNVATEATMNQPLAVAVDAAGDLFVGSDGVVRRVDAYTHVISTFAGYLGPAPPATCPPSPEDGEPASCAYFGGSGPAGLAVDSSGNVYVADDSTVQRIDASRTITTVASGLSDVHGLAFDPSGNLYIADTGDNEILQLTPDGTIRTIAGTAASLNKPMYLAWSPAPNLVVQRGQQGPAQIGSGILYFTDSSGYAVRRVDLSNDTISTLEYWWYCINDDNPHGSCTGPSSSNQYSYAALAGTFNGIAIDGAGNLFVSDEGSGGSVIDEIPTPELMPTGNTDIWVSKFLGLSIGSTTATNPYGTFVGDGGPPLFAQVSSPQALVVDSRGNLFVADEGFHRIRVITGVAQPLLPVTCAADASGLTSTTPSGFSYNFRTRGFAQTITLSNTGGSQIAGPIYVVLDNLSSNASLANGSGQTACAAPVGSPYVVSTGSLNSGASVTLPLQFTDPTRAAITYSIRVLAGAGAP